MIYCKYKPTLSIPLNTHKTALDLTDKEQNLKKLSKTKTQTEIYAFFGQRLCVVGYWKGYATNIVW